MSTTTFLWHDYETFGTLPRRDRPAQFAAIRTNLDLEEIGTPIMHYCQPTNDYLPDPEACLLTGITPQHCDENGIPEYRFAAAIEQALSANGTIGVGYNTIRFDDEVTRFLFWRNLIDPYAREWQNQCGRWDILDMVRTAYALRPDGMTWPRHENENNKPSFKLEHLTNANGIAHTSAHDALSDVRATIALGRLIRQQQPKLFHFCFALRQKERVMEEIGFAFSPEQRQPFLHISGMFPAERGCLAIVWPLAFHPTNRNELIVWNLAYDPTELFSLSPETIQQRLFSKADALPIGEQRLPIKSIHINKSPIVIRNLATLSAAQAERWKIDLTKIAHHTTLARQAPDMDAVWQQVFARTLPPLDVDEDLYNGFLSKADRRALDHLRQLSAEALARATPSFDDPRLETLLFRYRARNFPEQLTTTEQVEWANFRAERLIHGKENARSLPDFFDQIDALYPDADETSAEILSSLYAYGEGLLQTCPTKAISA